MQVCDVWVRERTRLYLAPSAQAVAARERARRGDPDGAIPVMRTAVNDLFETGQLTGGVLAAARLVEMLLDRGAHGDAAEGGDEVVGAPEASGSHGDQTVWMPYWDDSTP